MVFDSWLNTVRINRLALKWVYPSFTIALFFFLFHGIGLSAQEIYPDSVAVHEITIYAITSSEPLDWSSPASLYRSTLKGYVKNILKSEKSLIGHMFFSLSSPLLANTLYSGIASKSNRERRMMVLREKVGLSILGITLSAQMESEAVLRKKVDYYSKRGEIASITFRINEAAAHRMIDFYKQFTAVNQNGFSPSLFYGGGFWPRFSNEGSGCSAYCMAMLDVADLLGEEADKWRIDVNIPYAIMGGDLNENRKVKNRAIKKTMAWHNGIGTHGLDFERFSIYDPSRVFQWIKKQIDEGSSTGITVLTMKNGSQMPAIYIDRSDVVTDLIAPLFLQRPDSSVFIEHYNRKIAARFNHEAPQTNVSDTAD